MSGFILGYHKERRGIFLYLAGICGLMARLLKDHTIGVGRIGVFVTILMIFNLQGGCLWAPDIHERSSENQPPQLDFSLMEPNSDMKVIMTDPTVFSVTSAVSDPDDPVSNLYFWWFVDYRENQGPAMFAGPNYSQIQLDPCLYPQLADTSMEHTLEVVIVDPSGKVEYNASKGRTIEHAAVGLWEIQSHANCQ